MTVLRRRDRKRNQWFYKFQLDGVTYKKAGFVNRKEAAMAEAEERRRLGIQRAGMAFSQAVNKRLDYVVAFCTQDHFRKNVTRLNKFEDWWDWDINPITPGLIRERMIALSQQMSKPLANKHLVALRSVFEQAINDGIMARNPCGGSRFFPVERAVKYIPPREHLQSVLLLAQPFDQAYLTIIWQTAARVREINNLTWEDVDFSHRTVRLWTRKKHGGHKTPRLVEISDMVFSALTMAHKKRATGSPFVFTNPRTGKAYDYRRKFLDTLCRKAGVPKLGYHALRHARASELAPQRVPLPWLRDYLGHESIETTNRYLHSLGVR